MPQEYVGFSENALAYLRQAKVLETQPQIEKTTDCYIAPASTTIGEWIQELEGGVFTRDGRFLEASAQPRSDGCAAVKPSQGVRSLPQKATHIASAVFGGMILDHFGHFLLETPARMWALGDLPADLPWIFIAPPPSGVRSYHHKFLELLGLQKDRLLIATDWLHVDELYTPSSAICFHDWVSRAYIRPYQECSVSPRLDFKGKIFLTRAHLSFGVTVGEAELADLLRKSGWTIVRPEELPAEDQIALFRSDNLLAGLQGSAFHVALFSRPGRRMIHLCRQQGQRAYSMLDSLADADVTYFVAAEDHRLQPFRSSGPFLLDLDRTIAFLRARDLLGSQFQLAPSEQTSRQTLHRKYEAWWHHTQSAVNGNAAANEPERRRAAVDDANKAVSLIPEEHIFREHLINQVQVLEGPKAANALAREAQAAYPQHAKYHYMRSIYEDNLGHSEEAFAAIKAALSIEPRNVRFRVQLALLYYRKKLLNDAYATLRSVIHEAQIFAGDFYLLSLIEHEKKLPERALQSAARAAELGADDSLICMHHLNLLAASGRLTEATELAALYRQRFPNVQRFEEIEGNLKRAHKAASGRVTAAFQYVRGLIPKESTMEPERSDRDPSKESALFLVPDHAGDLYSVVLLRLHSALQPKTYFEIGTLHGFTLALAGCASVAVDPNFQLACNVVGKKPSCQLFQLTSDEFFAGHNLTSLLGDKVDFTFLDGMHLFEYLLRDFMNTEAHCRPSSVIALHDCVPTDLYVARRCAESSVAAYPSPPHPDWWAGDVWKVLIILKRYRPDLKIFTLDAAPTGLVLVTSLNPSDEILRQNYSAIVNDYRDVELGDYGLENFYRDINVASTKLVAEPEAISKLFCPPKVEPEAIAAACC